MSSEKEPFGHEWYQRELDIEINKLTERKTYKQQEEEGEKRLKEVIDNIKVKHLNNLSSQSNRTTRVERLQKLKTYKEEFPQLWELEGINGVHDIMQKRVSQNITAPILREEFVRQEKRDWRRLHPKKNGWGKYHDMSRIEFSKYFNEKCVNNLHKIAEWMDKHPNHPKTEYYKKTLFKS